MNKASRQRKRSSIDTEKNITSDSEKKVEKPLTPDRKDSLHVPSLLVQPDGKAVLLPGETLRFQTTRDEKGRFTKQSILTSAAPLPGSSALQDALSNDDLIDKNWRGPDSVQVYNLDVVPPNIEYQSPYAPIHNRYYAIWIVGTVFGMAAIGLIVHYFNL